MDEVCKNAKDMTFLRFFIVQLLADALELKHVLHRVVEKLRDEQCQRKRRDIVALLHGTDRLTADANGLRKLFLCDFFLLSQIAKAVVDGMFSGHMRDNGKDIRHCFFGQEWLSVFLKKELY